MQRLGIFLGLMAGLALTLLASAGQPGGAKDDAERIGQLVKDLGSPKFAVRDKAKRDLEGFGAAALPALRKAAESTDLETAKRAGELVKQLEEKATFDSLLQPKMVKLNFKDTPVKEAVEQLSKQSGYRIEIQGDRTVVTDRKVTLETGQITFWQAFDQLCEKAGLVQLNNNPYGNAVIDLPQIEEARPVPLPAPRPNLKGNVRPLPAVVPVPVPPPAPPPPQKGGNGDLQTQIDVQTYIVDIATGERRPGDVIQIQVDVQGGDTPVQNGVPPQPPSRDVPPPMVQGGAGAAGAQGGGVAGAQPGNAGQPVQVQVQPIQVQIQPAQVQVRPGVVVDRVQPSNYTPGQINVTPGKPQTYPTSYAGAVRIRVIPLKSAPVVPGHPAFPGGNGIIAPDGTIIFPNMPPQPGLVPLPPNGGGAAPAGGAGAVAPVQNGRVQIGIAQAVPVQVAPAQVAPPQPGNAVPQPGRVPPQPGVVPQPNGKPDEVTLALEVTPEPRLVQFFSIMGNVQVTSAVDDQGQKLTVSMNAQQPAQPVRGMIENVMPFDQPAYYNPFGPGQGFVFVRLKLGEKPAKALKELTGQLSVQMLTETQDLLSVEDVLKSAGKKVEGKHGGKIEIKSVEKQNGQYRVVFRLEQPMNAVFPNVQGVPGGPANAPAQDLPLIQGPANGRPTTGVRNINAHGLPVLVDAKGKQLNLVQNPQRNFFDGGEGMPIQEVSMLFAPQAGQGEPARLVLTGQRPIQVPVPFSFQNVPLPENR